MGESLDMEGIAQGLGAERCGKVSPRAGYSALSNLQPKSSHVSACQGSLARR